MSLQQMCRTCLSSDVALISLFGKSASSQTCTVAEMLEKFTIISVSETDGLPSKVCLSCVSEIKRSYFFKIKCESSQDTLQQYVKELSPEVLLVKDEKVKPETVFIQNATVTNIKQSDPPPTVAEQEVITADIMDQFEDEEILPDGPDDELMVVHTIQDDNFDATDNQTSYEINDYMENSSDGENQPDRITILACEECFQTFETKEEFEAHATECSKPHNENSTTKAKANNQASRLPKKCPHCPMDFIHQKNLDKHISKSHPCNSDTQKEAQSDPDDSNASKETSNEEASEKEDDNDEEDGGSAPEISPEDALLKHDPASLPSGQFTCTRCGAGFANIKSLQCHMKINKCMIKQFICKFCEKVFINDNSLIEHIKTHAKKFKCNKCQKSFSKAEKLRAHTRKVHNVSAKNQCKCCGKVFTMFSTLKDHLRTHSGEKPFLCSICGKGFSQNTNLKQHVMRHKNVKPFACKDCDLSFVSKGELNAHTRKHTGDHPFSCDVCSSTFTTSSSLVKHKRIHTGERPYACDLCPMRFAALGTLKNHRRTHTGEKPFKCDYCAKTFTQKSDCVTHARGHTGERPYTCKICGWGFPQSGTLRTHMKTHERDSKHAMKIRSSNEDDDEEMKSDTENGEVEVMTLDILL